ncbi:MAG: hypothetical protein Q8N85_03000 [Candidatus Omnitrophota bacterium]|nr:hypothetical protein [Candidatus Omnitrophota bacterium]
MKQGIRVLVSLSAFFLAFTAASQSQQAQPLKRDPFIPLLDEKGELRRTFNQPINEAPVLQLNLMGISKINDTYYAIIEGELLQKGDQVKGALIERIEADRAVLSLEGKKFELLLEKPRK